MSSKNMSFSKAFDELLPLEIKHMIFKWAASDGSSDVKIKLFHNDQDRLDAPAVDFLAKLKDQYSADAYHQALQYLTGPTFRWTFVSDAQPHRFLFRTFRRLVPMEIRQPIENGYLPRVTVNGLMNPNTLSVSLENLRMVKPNLPRDYSDYLIRLGARATSDHSLIVMEIKRDVVGGISLLPLMLPSLKKLDLGLEIIDCLQTDETSLAKCRQLNITGNFFSGLTDVLGALANLKERTSLDVHVIWNESLKREQTCGNAFDKDYEDRRRDHIIKELCLVFPAAKSIIGRPEDPPV